MNLAGYIETNKGRLIERWKKHAMERLSLKLEESELLNDLPNFIDDLVQLLRSPSQRPAIDSAKKHGRHRLRKGVDIGGLTEEIMVLGESVVELSHEDGEQPSGDEVLLLMRMIARGAAASAGAYAAMRDKQLADQAAQHFSFIAHELRNPLYNARLAADLLAASALDEHVVHWQTLGRALSQLTDLVDNSLVQARLYGQPDLSVQRLEARDLIQAACGEVALEARQKGIYVVVDAKPGDLDADRKLILSALTNLMKNAVKFTRDAGRVVARTRHVGDRILFEVEDECGGLAEDQPQRLFHPFVQVGRDRSGFGLGLVIVKQAAESHGGGVRVINQPGKGCCFVLDLPRRQQLPSTVTPHN